MTAPGAQRPVFVVQEYPPVLDTGMLFGHEVAVEGQPVSVLGNHISPPYPGRHARQSRQFQQSVGRSTCTKALNHHLPVLDVKFEAIVTSLTLYDTNGALTTLLRFYASDLLHVVFPHVEGGLYYG